MGARGRLTSKSVPMMGQGKLNRANARTLRRRTDALKRLAERHEAKLQLNRTKET